jgi:hypothetical protein
MTDVTLQQRDLDVLTALCEDRAECGQGLTRAELEHVAQTRWPHRCLRRLRESGHRIASVGTGEESERWQLLDPEPQAERAVDQPGSYVVGKDDQACAPRPVDGSLSEAKLFELPPAHHYDVRAEAA